MIPPRLSYRLKNKKWITQKVVHYEFEPIQGDHPPFKAGQFMMFHWKDKNGNPIDKPHSYSIASAPYQHQLDFTIKIYGIYTQRLTNELSIGDCMDMQGPYGAFTINEDSMRSVVLLAGGVGIAPFRSMIKDQTSRDNSIPITLLYSNKTQKDFPYRQELDTIGREYANRFRVIYTITDPLSIPQEWIGERGRFVAPTIARYVQPLEDKTFLVCGPPGFVEEMVEQIKTLGVDQKKIKIEKFT